LNYKKESVTCSNPHLDNLVLTFVDLSTSHKSYVTSTLHIKGVFDFRHNKYNVN